VRLNLVTWALALAVIVLGLVVIQQNRALEEMRGAGCHSRSAKAPDVRRRPPARELAGRHAPASQDAAHAPRAPADRRGVAVPPPEMAAGALELPVAPPPRSGRGTQKAATPAAGNSFAEMARKVVQDPAYSEMLRAQQKATMGLTYGAFFQYLEQQGIDPVPLQELRVEKMMAQMDLGLGLLGQSGDTPEMERKAREVGDVAATYEARIKALLGADNYSVFQQYERTQPERMQVDMFKKSLYGADQLSAAQEHELILGLYAERTNYYATANRRDPAVDVEFGFTQEAIAQQLENQKELARRYDARARTLLPPAQYERFKTSQAQQQALQEMAMQMALQMFGGTNTPAP